MIGIISWQIYNTVANHMLITDYKSPNTKKTKSNVKFKS